MDEDEKGVARFAFADDPCAGRKIVHEPFLREEGLRGKTESREYGDRGESIEQSRSGLDHLYQQ
jgi:hypothetical protein